MLRNFEQHDVSLTLYRGDPWFRASDVTDILGYRRSALAVRAHVEEKHVCTLAELHHEGLESNAAKQSIGSGGKSPLYVSEAGVYELMWHSKKPEALRFRQWLVEEVLPEKAVVGKTKVEVERLVTDLPVVAQDRLELVKESFVQDEIVVQD